MKTFFRFLCLVGLLVFISACDKDNTPPPTPLSQMVPDALNVNVLWFKNASNGVRGRYFTIGSGLNDQMIINAGVDGTVTALNANEGDILWHVTLPTAVTSTPALNNSDIFVSTYDGSLYALSQKDGSIVWKISLPSAVLGAPSANEEVVVVNCHDGSVNAYATDTGHALWSYNASIPSLMLYANSSPLIYNDKVFVGFSNGQLADFNLNQGQPLWQVPVALPSAPDQIGSMVDVDANPVFDSNAIFSVAYHGNLIAVNSDNGNLIWVTAVSSYLTPAVGQNRVVVTDETGRIIAYDESSGTEVWEQKSLLYRFVTAPVIFNNQWVVVGDYAGYVHFFALNNGRPLARIHLGNSGIRAQPLVADRTLIVTTNSGNVYALQVQE